MILFTDIVGYIASFLTVIVGVPQFIKTIRTKTVAAVSLLAFTLFYAGTVCWILYVTLTPNKWLPLGLTDIFSCFVTSLTISAIYKYSYLAKQQKVAKGENVLYFWPKLTPTIFTVGLFVFYAILVAFFIYAFKTGFAIEGKFVKYFFFVVAVLGVTLIFIPQIFKTIRTRSTEGLSLGIIIISLMVNTLWDFSWVLRIILNKYYNYPLEIASDPIKSADAIEEFIVALSLQFLGVAVFFVQLIAYIKYHDWSTTFSRKPKKSLTS